MPSHKRGPAEPLDPRWDHIPDVRDGLTRVERIILWQLSELQKERHGRNVPSAQLYGRISEYVSISPQQMQRVLARLGAMKMPGQPEGE